MESKHKSDFFNGVRSITPLALGVGMYGLAFGLLTSQAGFTWFGTGLMGLLVFAGSAQIVSVERLVSGAGVMAAFIAGVALNLRLILITASVRDLFSGRVLWQKMLGAHLSSDENWALTLARQARGQTAGYWFLVGAGLTIVMVWVIAGISGVLFSSYIPDPEKYAIDFSFTAAFIAISCSLWRGARDLLPWLVAIAVVIVTTRLSVFDSSWSIVMGGVFGALTAVFIKPSVDDNV